MICLCGSLKGFLLSCCCSPCRRLETVLRSPQHVEWNRLSSVAPTVRCVLGFQIFSQPFSDSFQCSTIPVNAGSGSSWTSAKHCHRAVTATCQRNTPKLLLTCTSSQETSADLHHDVCSVAANTSQAGHVVLSDTLLLLPHASAAAARQEPWMVCLGRTARDPAQNCFAGNCELTTLSWHPRTGIILALLLDLLTLASFS